MRKKIHTYRWLFIFAAVLCVVLYFVAIQLNMFGSVNTKLFMKLQPGTYQVQDFRDGDTVTVNMRSVTETVRFIGIDTPETHKENTPVQCYGPEASTYTKKRIATTKIKLVADRLTTNRDRYDRLLRYVVLEDGHDLGYELVRHGYAFAYSFPFANSKKYAKGMEQARLQKLGLWGHCQPFQDPLTGQWHSN